MVSSVVLMGEGPEHNPFAPPAETADFEAERYGIGLGAWHYASYGQRFAGAAIDNLLYLASAVPSLFFVWGRFAAIEQSENVGSELLGIYVPLAVGPLLLAAYQWNMTAKVGQTLGKRWLKTRIVRDGTGAAPGFLHGVVLRVWLLGLAGMLPGIGRIVGLADSVAIFTGNRRQTLHDRIAGTIVIQE